MCSAKATIQPISTVAAAFIITTIKDKTVFDVGTILSK